MIVMGPGWWYFNMKTKFNTTLTVEDEELLLGKLNEMLQEKFPGSDIMIKGDGFDANKIRLDFYCDASLYDQYWIPVLENQVYISKISSCPFKQ